MDQHPEIIAAPYTVWIAPVGTAFPTIDELPGEAWSLLGTNGDRNYSSGGVTVMHQRQIVQPPPPAGQTVSTVAMAESEILRVRLELLDITLEQYAIVMGGNAVLTTPPAPGVSGFKVIGLALPTGVLPPFAVLARGPSPYADGMIAQYELPHCCEAGSPQLTFRSGQPAGISVDLLALPDSAAASQATRFGRLVAQYAEALPPPLPELAALTLSASSIVENSAEDTLVGAIEGEVEGSTISLVTDAGGRFKLVGGNIVAGATPTDREAATSHNITIRQAAPGYGNSPNDTVLTITVTNVFEAPTLAALSIPAVVRRGQTVSISGATAGSAITGTLPSGWTLNSGARTIAIGAGAALNAQDWSLTETLADSANSPRTSTGSSRVEEQAPPVTPDLWYDFTNPDNATLSGANEVDAWAPEIGSFTATQTGTARPVFFPDDTATGGPKGRIRFTSGDFLQIPAGFTFDRRAHTAFFVTRRGANETGRGTFLMSTGAAANFGVYAWDNAQLFFWLGTTGQATGLGVGMGASCQWIAAGAADVRAGSDNLSYARGTPLTAGTFGGGRIGLWTGTNFPYTGDMQAALFFQRELSPAEIAQLQDWANTRFRAPASDNTTVVIVDGDSIDEGIQLQNPQLTPHATDFSWPAQWQLLQGANAPRIVNLGKGGAALANETAALDVIRELGYNSGYAKRIVIGGYSHNDIQGGRTAAQFSSDLDTWIANLRAADPGVIIGYRTCLESPTFTVGEEAVRVAVNNYIKGAVVDLDFFEDLAALPGLAGGAGKVDDVHPSSAGYAIMAGGMPNLSAQIA